MLEGAGINAGLGAIELENTRLSLRDAHQQRGERVVIHFYSNRAIGENFNIIGSHLPDTI